MIFFEGTCEEDGGCVSLGNFCLTKKVKTPFLQAGFSLISDRSIVEKLKAADSDYRNNLKYVNRESTSARQTRETYERAIEKTFHIISQDARALIEDDSKRTATAKTEDLAFYDDYFGENATRSMMFTSRDKQYDSCVEGEANRERKKQERKDRERVLREREERRVAEEKNNNEGGEGEDEERYEGDAEEEGGGGDDEGGGGEEEEEWEGGQNRNAISKTRYRRSRRGGGDGGDDGGEDDSEEEGEVGRIPHEILRLTAPTAVRLNMSVEQHLCMTAAFLKSSSVDIDKYPLSHSTAVRRRKEVLSEKYQEVRERFEQTQEDNDDILFVHLDTKALTDSIGPEGAAVNNTR